MDHNHNISSEKRYFTFGKIEPRLLCHYLYPADVNYFNVGSTYFENSYFNFFFFSLYQAHWNVLLVKKKILLKS